MLLFNIIACAIIFHLIGGWIPKLPRVFSIMAIIGIIAFEHPQIGDFIAFAWLFYCMKLLPTNALLSAINGQFPTREDGFWQWMQTGAAACEPENGFQFGVAYGKFRALPVLPALIYFMNPFMLIIFLQGEIYSVAGWLSHKFTWINYIMVAEFTMGAIFGSFIS